MASNITVARSKTLRECLNNLQAQLGVGHLSAALDTLRTCRTLTWSSEQNSLLAHLATGTALRVKEAAPSSARPWWQEALSLGVAGDLRLTCLQGVAEEALQRLDYEEAARYLDQCGEDDCSEALSLLRFKLAAARKDLEAAKVLLDRLLNNIFAIGLNDGLGRLHSLLEACGRHFELSFHALRRAFDASNSGEESNQDQKEELFTAALKMCMKAGRFQEANVTISSYVSFRTSDKSLVKHRGKCYDSILTLAEHHCKRLEALQKWESLTDCSAALTFFCQNIDDHNRKLAFLWHQVNALLKTGSTEKARSLMEVFKITDSDGDFLPLRIEMFTAIGQLEQVERLLVLLLLRKDSLPKQWPLFYSCLSHAAEKLASGGLVILVTRLLATMPESDVKCRLRLAEIGIRLHANMQSDGKPDLEGLFELIEGQVTVLAKLDDPTWISSVLWNASLVCSGPMLRLRGLSLATRLLGPRHERFFPTIMLMMVSCLLLYVLAYTCHKIYKLLSL